MRATCATIHMDALRGNLRRVRELAPGRKVLAVVKADAYGHGLERVARALTDADAFGVAAIQDGQRLRAGGFEQRIVVMSGIDHPDDLVEMRRLGLDSVVHSDMQIAWLAADRDPRPINIWLKIDSGMHRLGFRAGRAAAVYRQLKALPGVADDIVLMTHFANSDVLDDDLTQQQVRTFESATAGLPGQHSLANSAGVIGWPQSHGDWIRTGGALYGISLFAGKVGSDFGLSPAMTLSTRLIAVNHLRAGDRVGYGSTWQCPTDSIIGVAAIGYGDGYPRAVANGAPVLVNGRRARIAGRVSMDLTSIDLSEQPDARIGDPVVLWGQGLPIEEVADAAGTIGYDLVCGMTRRVRFVEAD